MTDSPYHTVDDVIQAANAVYNKDLQMKVGQIRLLILGYEGFSAGLLLERSVQSSRPNRTYAPDEWRVELLATGTTELFSQYDIGRELNPLEVLAYAADAP